jgi:hypothetical protein
MHPLPYMSSWLNAYLNTGTTLLSLFVLFARYMSPLSEKNPATEFSPTSVQFFTGQYTFSFKIHLNTISSHLDLTSYVLL